MSRQGSVTESFEVVRGKDCFVCAGLTDAVPSLCDKAVKAARRYQFDTFAVGVSLPDGVQEREDELRSDLKLRGAETMKTQTAKQVAESVSGRLRKKVDRQKPDLTLLMNLGTGDVGITTRPVYYYARYTKPRGVSQRRELCERCSGAGCPRCSGTGYSRKASVEGSLRKRFEGFTGSEKMTFTWLGSEDRDSLVHPPGRPFVVEVKNPVKRGLPRRFAARLRGGKVAVSLGRALPSKPVRLPTFSFRTEITAVSSSKVGPDALADLKREFRGAEVRFERPYERPATKTVYRASATARGKTLLIDAVIDGGLPVKRFVSGELVSPSVSEVLKTEVRCRRFDIREVKETGEFEFAEVARSKKEN
jgi:tRNA pseudouridine synthase 10